jgi:O-antigen/teichoic acid export membrane protein
MFQSGDEAALTAPAVSTPVDASVPGGGRLVSLRLIQYTALFAANVLVARALGPSERAQYALPLALMAVVLIVSNMSIEQASGRALARREASVGDLFAAALFVSVVFGSVAAAVCFAVGLLTAHDLLGGSSATAVALAAGALPLALADRAFGGLLLRTGRLLAFGAVNVVSCVVQLAGVVAFSAGPGLTAERALVMFVIATAILAVGSASFALKDLRARGVRVHPPPRSVLKRVLRDGFVLQGATVGLFLMFRVDMLIVAALTNPRRAGLYTLSASLVEIVFVAATMLGQTGLHRITTEPDHVAARFTLAFTRRVVAIGGTGAILLAAVSYPGILVLYGRAWTGSALPLAILALAGIAITLAGPMQAYLVRAGRLRDISAAALGSLVANVALNLVLIPWLGIAGAALASLVTYWAFALLLLDRFRALTGQAPWSDRNRTASSGAQRAYE